MEKVLAVLIPILIVLVLIGIGFYFIRKKLIKMQVEQTTLVNQHKQTVSIFVIDKKKAKITDGTFPKSVMAQFPKYMKWKKMPLVKGRVNNQMVTLICDDKVFKDLPTGKILKVDVAGLYIVDIKSRK